MRLVHKPFQFDAFWQKIYTYTYISQNHSKQTAIEKMKLEN